MHNINSFLPLILSLKTCMATGQDSRVIKTTPPMCRYGAVTWQMGFGNLN